MVIHQEVAYWRWTWTRFSVGYSSPVVCKQGLFHLSSLVDMATVSATFVVPFRRVSCVTARFPSVSICPDAFRHRPFSTSSSKKKDRRSTPVSSRFPENVSVSPFDNARTVRTVPLANHRKELSAGKEHEMYDVMRISKVREELPAEGARSSRSNENLLLQRQQLTLQDVLSHVQIRAGGSVSSTPLHATDFLHLGISTTGEVRASPSQQEMASGSGHKKEDGGGPRGENNTGAQTERKWKSAKKGGPARSISHQHRELTRSALREQRIERGLEESRLETRHIRPRIIPHGDAILVAFGHLRAVVWADELLLFQAHDHKVRDFSVDLIEQLAAARAGSSSESSVEARDAPLSDKESRGVGRPAAPAARSLDHPDLETERISFDFEIVALRCILTHICEGWERRVMYFKPLLENSLRKLDDDTDGYASSANVTYKLATLLPLLNSLESFRLLLTDTLAVLEEILEDDEEMLHMLLSHERRRLLHGGAKDLELHSKIQLILEQYVRQLSGLLSQTNYLTKKISAKQEVAKISLDSYRNRILRTNLSLAIWGLGFAIPTAIAGHFGMNLQSGLELVPGVFHFVMAGSVSLGIGAIAALGFWVSGRSPWDRKLHSHSLSEMKAYGEILHDLPALDRSVQKILGELAKDKGLAGVTREQFRYVFSCVDVGCIKSGKGEMPIN